jgi:hypothetical protein
MFPEGFAVPMGKDERQLLEAYVNTLRSRRKEEHQPIYTYVNTLHSMVKEARLTFMSIDCIQWEKMSARHTVLV